MELIILFAICTLIMRLGLPFASTTDGSDGIDASNRSLAFSGSGSTALGCL